MSRLDLARSQILAFRRHVGALDDRLPPGRTSLRRAAWAGLQDSMPRAALLSIHARVKGTRQSTWEDPSLVQIWGRGTTPSWSPPATSPFSRWGCLPTTYLLDRRSSADVTNLEEKERAHVSEG